MPSTLFMLGSSNHLGQFSPIPVPLNLSFTPKIFLSESVSQICETGPSHRVIPADVYNDFICTFTNQHISEDKLGNRVRLYVLGLPTWPAKEPQAPAAPLTTMV